MKRLVLKVLIASTLFISISPSVFANADKSLSNSQTNLEFKQKSNSFFDRSLVKSLDFELATTIIDLDNQTEKAYDSGKNQILSLLLSMFIPGAGQIYNEEYLKGFLIFTGFTGLTLLHFFFFEPNRALAESTGDRNSTFEILSLFGKIGIPSIWFYGWGSAYQSIDPKYIKEQEKKEKDRLEKEKNNLTNLINIRLFSYKF